MKLLMVGKTGVFETLAVASGYLDQPDISACPFFPDLALENSRTGLSKKSVAELDLAYNCLNDTINHCNTAMQSI